MSLALPSPGHQLTRPDGAGVQASEVTVIVNVCGALASTPPFAVPPLSCNCTVTVAGPFAFAAAVKVSVPLAATAGCAENSALLLFVTMKLSACADSSGGPALIAAAQPTTVCVPASSSTV